MNLNPKNWFFPQWITNVFLIVFLSTLFRSSYALFGSHKYGGVTPFTVIGTVLVLYGHLHNFGLQSDITAEEFLLRVIPGVGTILVEVIFTIIAAVIFSRIIYWKDILLMIVTLIVYVISVSYCYNKIETKTVTYDELQSSLLEMQGGLILDEEN